jgi:hypothetical protein
MPLHLEHALYSGRAFISFTIVDCDGCPITQKLTIHLVQTHMEGSRKQVRIIRLHAIHNLGSTAPSAHAFVIHMQTSV